MVVERVEFNAVEGQVDALVAYLTSTRAILENSQGCRSVMVGAGVENPGKVFLLVGWDSIELHKAATQTDAFGAWREKLKGYVAGAAVEHFAVAYPA
jgi:quinol monooxygenase YgiN